jgi:predicted metalloprotease with PDZ domain
MGGKRMRSSSILFIILLAIAFSVFGSGIAPNRCLGEEKDENKQLKEELRSLQVEVRELREQCKGLRHEVVALTKRVDEEAAGYIGIEVGKLVGKENRLLRVTHVAKGSPAEKAGITKGVGIGSVRVGRDPRGRREIFSVEEFRQAVGNLKPGDQIEISYLDEASNGYDAKITLGKRP